MLLEEQFPTYLAIGSKEKINGRIFLQIIEIINKYLSFAYSGSLMATIITEKDWQNVLTLEMLRDSEQIEYNAEKR